MDTVSWFTQQPFQAPISMVSFYRLCTESSKLKATFPRFPCSLPSGCVLGFSHQIHTSVAFYEILIVKQAQFWGKNFSFRRWW